MVQKFVSQLKDTVNKATKKREKPLISHKTTDTQLSEYHDIIRPDASDYKRVRKLRDHLKQTHQQRQQQRETSGFGLAGRRF